MRLPGASCPATQSASRLAKVPLGGQVAQKLRPAEHCGDLADGLDLHLRAGPAAVAGVVVGIDGHGQRIGCARHRMRRLEHLPGIERMKVGVVVAQPVGDFFQNLRHRMPDRPRIRRRAGQRTAPPAARWRGTSRPGTGSCRHGNPLAVTQPEYDIKTFQFNKFAELQMEKNGTRNAKNFSHIF